MSTTIINVAYLVASIIFILGLKGLTHPRSAVRGNLLGAVGMAIAAVVTLFDPQIGSDLTLVFAGIAVGGVIGALLAVRIEMTAMPQLVAIFNGFGGIASVLVAAAALYGVMGAGDGILPEAVKTTLPKDATVQMLVATMASGLIGAVTFTGSLVAFAKLQDFRFMRKINGFPGGQVVNAILFIASIGLSGYVTQDPTQIEMYWVLVAVASVLGILLVVPIGGADMPVVIALLNSYSGLAASATGFVLQNNVLIIAGSLVGASGLILTQIMCKAMNRSLTNVLFGKLEASSGSASADEVYAGKVKSTSPEEVAMLF
ncbi:MAG: NAD(P)(+) transhydrogenase (Re/Si-specific) subunit beta, partial [Myxococcota bacterium]